MDQAFLSVTLARIITEIRVLHLHNIPSAILVGGICRSSLEYGSVSVEFFRLVQACVNSYAVGLTDKKILLIRGISNGQEISKVTAE